MTFKFRKLIICLFNLFVIRLLVVGSAGTCPHRCTCSSNISIIVIECNGENLTSLPHLSGYEYDTTKSKVELYLNRNRFGYILHHSFFSIVGRLRVLELMNNEQTIEVAYSAFLPFTTSLEILRIDPLSEGLNDKIDVFSSLSSLVELSVSSGSKEIKGQVLSNQLFSPELNSALRVLELHHCDLLGISDGTFGQLRLRALNLSHNKFSDIPQVVTSMIAMSLTSLYMDNNRIHRLKSSYIPRGCKLRILDLSFNNLVVIDRKTLGECRQLYMVNLSHNMRLVSITFGTFHALMNLIIDLDHTNISSLNFIEPGQINTLKIQGSRIPCTCELQLKYVSDSSHKLKGTCVSEADDTSEKIDHEIIFLDMNCEEYKKQSTAVKAENCISGVKGYITRSVIGITNNIIGPQIETPDYVSGPHTLIQDYVMGAVVGIKDYVMGSGTETKGHVTGLRTGINCHVIGPEAGIEDNVMNHGIGSEDPAIGPEAAMEYRVIDPETRSEDYIIDSEAGSQDYIIDSETGSQDYIIGPEAGSQDYIIDPDAGSQDYIIDPDAEIESYITGSEQVTSLLQHAHQSHLHSEELTAAITKWSSETSVPSFNVYTSAYTQSTQVDIRSNPDSVSVSPPEEHEMDSSHTTRVDISQFLSQSTQDSVIHITPIIHLASEIKQLGNKKTLVPVSTAGAKHARVVPVSTAGAQHARVVPVSTAGAQHARVVPVSTAGAQHARVVPVSTAGAEHARVVPVSTAGAKHARVVQVSTAGAQHARVVPVSTAGAQHARVVPVSTAGAQHARVVPVSTAGAKHARVVPVSTAGAKHARVVPVSTAGAQHARESISFFTQETEITKTLSINSEYQTTTAVKERVASQSQEEPLLLSSLSPLQEPEVNTKENTEPTAETETQSQEQNQVRPESNLQQLEPSKSQVIITVSQQISVCPEQLKVDKTVKFIHSAKPLQTPIAPSATRESELSSEMHSATPNLAMVTTLPRQSYGSFVVSALLITPTVSDSLSAENNRYRHTSHRQVRLNMRMFTKEKLRIMRRNQRKSRNKLDEENSDKYQQDEARLCLLKCPLWIVACFIHGCLTFVVFLAPQRGRYKLSPGHS